MTKDVVFREVDFIKHIDNGPLVFYVVLSILMLIVSLFYSLKLSLYGAIPLILANFVGSYKEDKYILNVINVTYIMFFMLFYNQINIFR